MVNESHKNVALTLAIAGKAISAVLLPFGQGKGAAQVAFTAIGSWVREEMVRSSRAESRGGRAGYGRM